MIWTNHHMSNRYEAKLGETLNISITTQKAPERNASGSYIVKLVSGHIAVMTKNIAASNDDKAKELAISEIRNYIEEHIHLYQNWMEMLERADSRQ